MLVTKKEVKMISKKALSLLLAVMMMVTSMSVCFGTFTMAANLGGDHSGYKVADAYTYLAEHLNGATVKKYTDKYNIGNTKNEGKASNSNDVTYITDITVDTYEEYCELRDIIIYLDLAIKGTSCYQTGTADNKDESTKSCVAAGDVEAEILDGLAGETTVSNAAKEFIAYVLEDERATQHDKAGGDSSSPKNHTATLNVFTTDYKGYLDAHDKGDYSTVDASIEMGYTYTMYMRGDLYYETTGTCAEKKYHNMIWIDNLPAAPSSMSAKANTSTKTTLANYASEVDSFIATNNFNKMALMSATDIETLKNTLESKTNTIKDYIADEGEGKQDEIYDKFFPGYKAKVEQFNSDADDAKSIAAYSALAYEIADLQAAYPAYGVFNWGGFNEATIKADYAAFTTAYASLLNNATVYKYFTETANVFSHDFIVNFRDNTVAYDLEDLREEKVQPLYDTYKDTWNTIEFAEQQVAYSDLSGYVKNIKSYNPQVQNAIFPDLDLFLDLEEKLECTVADCIVYFAENVGKDYSDVLTDDVIKEIATANSQLAALNALANSVDYAGNASLLDVPFANAATFIDYLYSLLGARFTAQVNVANDAYNEINRPNKELTIAQYSHLSAYINAIEPDIVTYLDGVGQGAKVSAATRNMYDTLKAELMPAFTAFESDRGYSKYSAADVLIRREDKATEIFRENADLDSDGVGEYEVTDANVEKIVNLLDAALKDETVKKLLGDLINKDEDGNPKGEAFNLGALVSGLLEDVVYTDALINTVMQFVYPLVLKEFAKVWAGLPPTITIPDVDTGVLGMKADVEAGLKLDDVETAIASVGLFIAPTTLAANLNKVYGDKYQAVEDVLNLATTKANYDKANDTFRNPWENTNLFRDVIDETTGEPVIGDDGKVKREYNLVWGVDTATDKKAAFLDAAVAALSGLEPLLMALIANKEFTNPDVTDGDARGIKIGYGKGNATVIGVDLSLSIDPITLTLNFSANDGWDNALAPIFEALGLTNIPHSEDLQTTRKLLENGLFAMIDQLIAKLNDKPVEFLLNALPNLAYMIEAGMIEPLLYQIKTVINYYADAIYDAGVASGQMLNAMKSEEPININIGEMINLKDMGLDISNFEAIWNMIAGGVEMLAGIEAPDASLVATLGNLIPKATNRSVRTYTATTSNGVTLKSDEAWYIDADIAAVLEYLIQWVLESGLLNGLVKEPSELITGIFAAIEENPNDVIAAVVELLNQQVYPAKEYEWFNGTVDGESVMGNSAYEIYLNPNNDWTKEKAEYLYNNLETLLTTVLTMIGTELDLEALVADAIDGVLTDKTLTALAALLANLDVNALLNKDKTEEEIAKALDVNALIKSYLGLDLAAIAAEYADIAAAKEADTEYVYDFGVDAGTTTFAAALADILAPLSVVLDYLLVGGNLTITIGTETVTLPGGNGYNNGIVPLLEALGCAPATATTGIAALTATVEALLAKVEALTTNTEEDERDGLIYGAIEMLPSIFYFITSNGLSTTILNLLQPVLTIVDIINPVFDVMGLINGLEIGEEGAKKTIAELLGGNINLEKIDLAFIFDLLPTLVPAIAELDLTGVEALIYDICGNVGSEYTSAAAVANTVNGKAMKGAYTEGFDQADLLTVVLSFALEWATVADNAKKLDEMLNTDGLIEAIGTVLAGVDVDYATPTWYYWFADDEDAFEAHVNGDTALPNSLASLTYPNDWSAESAEYIADNLSALVDDVIALVEINGTKYESLSALVEELLAGYITADTIEMLVATIANLLGGIDEKLIETAGILLGIDLVGLKSYECEAEITDIDSFVAELANVLTTYAGRLINWLFFGDDYAFAKKSDNSDTIVISGGEGYEKGIALLLEALGCEEIPAADNATVENVLAALGNRVEAILENPVDEVIALLPNLVYFLNADGATVVVNNILAPINTLLAELSVLGVNLDLGALIGFDLSALSLADILALVEDSTGLKLDVAEEVLVGFGLGKIEKSQYGYKMVAEPKDTITVVLTTALQLLLDDEFTAKLDELLNTEGLVKAIKDVFVSVDVEYTAPNWEYAATGSDMKDVIDYAITYPNNWTEATAQYVATNLPVIVNEIIPLIEINGTKYESVSALLDSLVGSLYTADTLKAIQTALADLIGGLDENLADLVNVGLGVADKLLGANVNGLINYEIGKIETKEDFIAALTGMLMEVEGLIDWLLLGENYEFFVDDDGDMVYEAGEAIITINGANGYTEGLALLLEALGVAAPAATNDTAETINAVLSAVVARIDAIIADPVNEVLELLPNIIYFLNANGVSAVVNNTIAAINALIGKLEVFGIELDILSLVNLKDILNVEADIALNNITITSLLAVASELTGLELAEIESVLTGFAIGELSEYDSINTTAQAYKMTLTSDFDKADLITVVATLAIITIANDDNATVIEGLVGPEAYQLILNLLNKAEIDVPVQEFDWQFIEKEGEIFSALGNSDIFEEYLYGPQFTEEKAEYIADDFGAFVDNIIYLLGIEINGTTVNNLKDLIDGLLNGSVYTRENVIAIRDALAGVLANVKNLEVSGINAGKYIVEILAAAEIADLNAVAKVQVPEFEMNDREGFVSALCAVLAPLDNVLEYLLANGQFTFFVDKEQANAITLNGAEGYAYGIIPLLEVLDCKDILTPAEYYAAVEKDSSALLGSILTPLLNRIDEILADDPAQAILDMLPNLIYFINSNGVDTVVKNTLHAVYVLLATIKPIAEIDLYELLGFDLATIDFEWLFNKLLEVIADATGYEFEDLDVNAINELTVGKLESYTSLNGKTAYKMVYAEGESGNKAEMVTVIERLLVTFIMHEKNQEMLLGILRDNLGMTPEAEKYVVVVLSIIADCSVETQLGMDAALSTIYYIYYGADLGADSAASGLKDLNETWTGLLQDMVSSTNKEEAIAGEIIATILGLDIFKDIVDPEGGIAPNGLLKFFQKVIEWFNSISAWFQTLFA